MNSFPKMVKPSKFNFEYNLRFSYNNEKYTSFSITSLFRQSALKHLYKIGMKHNDMQSLNLPPHEKLCHFFADLGGNSFNIIVVFIRC